MIFINQDTIQEITDAAETTATKSGYNANSRKCREIFSHASVDKYLSILASKGTTLQSQADKNITNVEIQRLREQLKNCEAALAERDAEISKMKQTAWMQPILQAKQDRINALEAAAAALQDEVARKKSTIGGFAQQLNDLSNRLTAAEKQSNQWVLVTDPNCQAPTEHHTDADGCLIVCDEAGYIDRMDLSDLLSRRYPGNKKLWWRPANLPVTLSPFKQWQRSLSEEDISRMGDPDTGELEEIFKSVTGFNPQTPKS